MRIWPCEVTAGECPVLFRLGFAGRSHFVSGVTSPWLKDVPLSYSPGTSGRHFPHSPHAGGEVSAERPRRPKRLSSRPAGGSSPSPRSPWAPRDTRGLDGEARPRRGPRPGVRGAGAPPAARPEAALPAAPPACHFVAAPHAGCPRRFQFPFIFCGG